MTCKGLPMEDLNRLMVGRTPTLQPKTLAGSSIFETFLIGMNSLFSWLIFNPNIASNHIKTQLKYSRFSLLAYKKNEGIVLK